MQTFKYTVNNSAFKGEHFTKRGEGACTW